MDTENIARSLDRIATALERLAPPARPEIDWNAAQAFVWRTDLDWLEPVPQISRIEAGLLLGIDRQKQILLDNTLRFAKGLPANNTLLWGSRGTGKSSIVKAIHAEVCDQHNQPLVLVEIHREDIQSLPRLLTLLRAADKRFILFCDDLSFESEDASYKSLKAVLDGGVEGRPENVIFYATSNRRHLLSRDMIENEKSTAIHAGEAVEEKVSLSDRFGLWLGFHNLDQPTFFAIIEGYAEHYGLKMPREELQARAREWSVTRGSRSGRVAWQFIQDLAGELEVRLK
ncbi:MAG: ATP-binding protein [Rhodospirillales bacterium]